VIITRRSGDFTDPGLRIVLARRRRRRRIVGVFLLGPSFGLLICTGRLLVLRRPLCA